jgi:hypothetical protein
MRLSGQTLTAVYRDIRKLNHKKRSYQENVLDIVFFTAIFI